MFALVHISTPWEVLFLYFFLNSDGCAKYIYILKIKSFARFHMQSFPMLLIWYQSLLWSNSIIEIWEQKLLFLLSSFFYFNCLFWLSCFQSFFFFFLFWTISCCLETSLHHCNHSSFLHSLEHVWDFCAHSLLCGDKQLVLFKSRISNLLTQQTGCWAKSNVFYSFCLSQSYNNYNYTKKCVSSN